VTLLELHPRPGPCGTCSQQCDSQPRFSHVWTGQAWRSKCDSCDWTHPPQVPRRVQNPGQPNRLGPRPELLPPGSV
jgi:hypothetical protein